MPLFASFDSIYTEPTSETHPEFSLSLRGGLGIEEETSRPTLADHDPSNIHDKLIEFDTSGIPEIIQATEPGSYNPINPIEYIQPDIDPVTQMELALAQGDAWAAEAAGQHPNAFGRFHMWDHQDGPRKFHKHVNGHTITTTLNENGDVAQRTTTGGTLSKITPESEGGGARIAAQKPIAFEALDQPPIEMSYNESLRSDNRFVFEPFHAMTNLGESPAVKEASNWDVICDIGTSVKQANATHQLQDLGNWLD